MKKVRTQKQPASLTQRELAAALNVPYQRVNELVNGRRGVTLSTALRLAKYFDVSPSFWLNLQLRWDLYHAMRSEASELEAIEPRGIKFEVWREGSSRAC